MKHAQHQNRFAVVAILERVGPTKDLENNLTIFFAGCDRSAQLRMSPENVGPDNELVGDVCREVRELLVEKRGKSIEVGEGVERSLDVYWPGNGRNLGVPQVRNHCTTRS